MEIGNYYDQRDDNHRQLVLLNLLLPVSIMVIVGIPLLACYKLFDSWQNLLGAFLTYFLIWYGLTLAFAYVEMKRPLNSIAGKLKLNLVDENYQILRNVVDELAIGFDMKAPQIYIAQGIKELNAFAISSNHQDAIIVTQSLLDALTRSELSGVIGHEMAHLKAKDSSLMLRFSLYTAGVAAFYTFGYDLFWFGGDMFEASLAKNDLNYVGIFVIVAIVLGLPCLVLGYVGKLAALILQFAVSRNREYDADMVSAQVNQTAAGLISALRKVQNQDNNKHQKMLKIEFAPLYFVDNEDLIGSFKNLFACHPSIDDRIERLARLG